MNKIDVKVENIVFLKIHSWRGSVGGEHYYGKLSRYQDYCNPDIEVKRILSSKEAKKLNRKDGTEDKFCRFRSGDKTS